MNIYRRFWIFIVLFIIGFNIMTCGLFWLRPMSYYFRGWEYFEDFYYKSKESFSPVWNNTHSGDLARKQFFLFQKTKPVYMSTTTDGFRAPFMKTDSYPIIVIGDSVAFGSGLSDHETFSWRLSEKTGIPVFNGARQNINNVLKHPKLKDLKLVIELITERSIRKNIYASSNVRKDKYLPIARNQLRGYWNTLYSISSERYFSHSLIFRSIKRIGKDISLLRKNNWKVPPYLFDYHRFGPGDLEQAGSDIIRRAKQFKKLGYTYIFLPIPVKQTFYLDDLDDFTRSYLDKLTQRLRDGGVKTMNFRHYWEKEKGKRLFIKGDTHWSPHAVDITVREFIKNFRLRSKRTHFSFSDLI